ncbi:MAG: hypothetical protein M1829_006073 [Trizodia sp. TS-e1964]|nr:MAG: hypothetical protein M1829_006073 [Trizodia sp. TS-e1964]
MFRVSFRRSPRWRYARAVLLVLLTLTLLDSISLYCKSTPPAARPALRTPGRPQQKLFIASTHWNNEPILRKYWNNAVVKFARDYGPENVYVSVYESGSWDDSKGALRDLDARLEEIGVQRSIVLDSTTHQDEISKPAEGDGWVEAPKKGKTLRRIPYLAKIRNLSLGPLEELARQGTVFDKIVFLNDVVFTLSIRGATEQTDDVLNLLYTRDGNYAAACALDFHDPPIFYDTFALRDSAAHPAVSQHFPYFGTMASRHAIITGQPVPVQSCWNGMAIFAAAPFTASPTSKALRFRGISDALARYHLEGSECCLIHYDNPLTALQGVWVNPNVRVGYNGEAYARVTSSVPWPSPGQRVIGVWRNRLTRGFRFSISTLRSWRVAHRVRLWMGESEGRSEPGLPCLVNEMQVLVANGWAHV